MVHGCRERGDCGREPTLVDRGAAPLSGAKPTFSLRPQGSRTAPHRRVVLRRRDSPAYAGPGWDGEVWRRQHDWGGRPTGTLLLARQLPEAREGGGEGAREGAKEGASRPRCFRRRCCCRWSPSSQGRTTPSRKTPSPPPSPRRGLPSRAEPAAGLRPWAEWRARAGVAWASRPTRPNPNPNRHCCSAPLAGATPRPRRRLGASPTARRACCAALSAAAPPRLPADRAHDRSTLPCANSARDNPDSYPQAPACVACWRSSSAGRSWAGACPRLQCLGSAAAHASRAG